MAKQKNPNYRPDSFPARLDADKMRKSIDPDLGALRKHEAAIAKLDRLQRAAEKGGRSK